VDSLAGIISARTGLGEIPRYQSIFLFYAKKSDLFKFENS